MNVKAIILILTSIRFESDYWDDPWNEDDDNMNVWFTLSDGTKWVATFFTYQNIISLSRKNKSTGECLSGLYFCATDMILIEKLTKDSIQKVLDDMILKGGIPLHCNRIEDGDDTDTEIQIR